MKNILCLFLIVSIALLAPACSRKSGCPAESAQSQVDKNGEYKVSKTKSGLLPPKGYHKKIKGKYKSGKKVKHSN
ncbi:MAG: hypothetical protein IPP15_14985 [Saprospiraceae bacterium]|uniref:Lipoprotein n=1 Tax=Candidatus Opimibacter skivensis TaxID=2982028 RepID=A0A9D7SWW0_9BACT|nr:hypothetical protein [Candidatus Opimibacter skivensis]